MSEFSFESLLMLDALVAAGVIIASLAFAYTIGRYTLVPMITALGIGATFVALAPYTEYVPGIGSWPVFQQHIVMFVVVTMLAYLTFRRHEYFEPSVVPTRFESMICGLLIAGFTLTVIGVWLPEEILMTISPQLRWIFGEPIAQTLWILAPILVFGAMRRR